MKNNFIVKAKWYILGFVLVAIMLSVSLSFCSWDNFSFKSKFAQSNSGIYDTKYKLAEDKDNSGSISVGDIITYGRFYQDSNAITTAKKDPLRWIVVDYDKINNIATLITEQIIVYGNMWGEIEKNLNQNYYVSTLRSWLNSGKGSLRGDNLNWNDSDRFNDNTRNDGIGSQFSINQANVANKGFLDVAFSDYEKSFIIPKKIEQMKCRRPEGGDIIECATSDGRNYINDLVWIPSYQEIYGTTEYPYISVDDGLPNAQFKYFDDVKTFSGDAPNRIFYSEKSITTPTQYAINAGSTSYYNNGNGGYGGNMFWLRTSRLISQHDMVAVYPQGQGSTMTTYWVHCGVRPSINVKL